MRSKTAWIEKQIAHFRSEPRRVYRFIEGEEHLYLGKKYPIRFRDADGGAPFLFHGETFSISHNLESASMISRLFDRWYAERAREIFAERLEICHKETRQHSLPFPAIKIRKMRSRWGSCSPYQTISLNSVLARMPVACIDYVIMHELCHLKIRNHGPGFYAMLGGLMPDWRERKNLLNSIGINN
jgi:hypothetical protein